MNDDPFQLGPPLPESLHSWKEGILDVYANRKVDTLKAALPKLATNTLLTHIDQLFLGDRSPTMADEILSILEAVRQELEKRGCEPALRNRKLLTYAAATAEPEVLRWMMDYQAHIPLAHYKGDTPIGHLVATAAPESYAAKMATCLDMLLEAGDDPLAADENGRDAISWACGSAHPMMKLPRLLAHSAQTVNRPDVDGYTPLHYMACACEAHPKTSLDEFIRAVDLMLAHGADLEAAMYGELRSGFPRFFGMLEAKRAQDQYNELDEHVPAPARAIRPGRL